MWSVFFFKKHFPGINHWRIDKLLVFSFEKKRRDFKIIYEFQSQLLAENSHNKSHTRRVSTRAWIICTNVYLSIKWTSVNLYLSLSSQLASSKQERSLRMEGFCFQTNCGILIAPSMRFHFSILSLCSRCNTQDEENEGKCWKTFYPKDWL